MVETITRKPHTTEGGAVSSQDGQGEARASRSASKWRVISSTSIITISLFMLVNFAIERFDPLEHLFWTGLTGARQHIFVSKLPKLLSSPTPDVLLLGTSVSLFPAVRADDQMAGKPARWDFWYERNVILPYDKALYLEKSLSSWAGHPVSVANASVAGGLVSDQYLILQKFISAGKKPKQLIVCVSPRDFLDNARADIKSTPTYTALQDLSSLPELIQKGASWQSIVDVSLGQISNYYLHRQEYNHFLTHLAAKELDRPVDLFDATNKNEVKKVEPDKGAEKRDTFFNPSDKAIYKQTPNTLHHLSEYKSMYLPVDRKQFAVQTSHYNKLLRLAAENHIPVLVVNTPLPVENTNLLPPRVRLRYQDNLKEGCTKSGATLLQPAVDKPYDTAEDFEDASHMSIPGSMKFWAAITDTLKRDPQAVAALANK